MRRIMGTEVEYGISVPGDATANPVLTSTQVVLAYAAAADIPRARRARWDYEVESPLRDARGFDLSGARRPASRPGRRGPRRGQRHPDQRRPAVRRPRAPGVLGARGHQRARRGHLGQGRRAGDGGGRACKAASVPGQPRLQLYKNNVDGKGASYGTHENYLCPQHAVHRGDRRSDAVLRLAPGRHRLGPGRHRRSRRRRRLPALPARRLHRGRGRPGDHAQARASSTPATSRTPTPTSTAGCTSSSATPTWPSTPRTSRSARRRWCWT